MVWSESLNVVLWILGTIMIGTGQPFKWLAERRLRGRDNESNNQSPRPWVL